MRDRPGTAEQKIAWGLTGIDAWVKAGRKILTPHGDELVMQPPLSEVDGCIYPSKGGPVFRELRGFTLEDPPMSLKEDGKRTMNRFLQKAEGEIRETLDRRLLSMVFWIGVAKAIDDHQGQ
ncbi:MAG: hypothetical protein AAF416_22555 [Pseudomonadota bacterium]